MYNNTNERGVRHPNTQQTAAGQVPPPAAAAAGAGLTYGQSAASGPAPTTAGHHKHDMLNKLDPRIDSTHDRQAMPQHIPEGTYGPHSSRLANALDPRVDSDLDSARTGAGAGAGMGMGAGGGLVGSGDHTATATAAGVGRHGGGAAVPEGMYGPHSSRAANAMDPMVDSDRDRHVGPGATHGGHQQQYGAVGAGRVAGGAPMMGTTAAGGVGGAGSGMAAGGPHTAGPHSSDLLNKLDPRVDSKTGVWKDGSGTRGPV
ncbi:hypothetical protein C8A00DRAFT_41747 [Chaetomidium leptoderma]|uniref:Uncharacterized protein n=1 Tax=Chaetomidium leptoderma TaxID=669021 RepID=A0AAN6VQQ9_9PEZI|nr:hypothetical protein C8A00DRAFT_41747 [Chaetomidium leptoderma]